MAVVVARVGEYVSVIRFVKPVLALVGGALIFHVAYTARQRWIELFSRPFVRLIAAYAVAITLSIPFSIWRGKSVETAFVVPFALAMIISVGLTQASTRSLDIVLRGLVWGASAAAVLALIQGNVVEGSRLSSAGSYDPNDLASLFALALPFAIGASFRGRALIKLSNGVASGILLVALLKTGSRGGLIALVVGSIVLLFSLRPRQFGVVLVTLCLVVPVAWSSAPDVMRERAASLLALDEDYNTTSNSGRLYLWGRGAAFAVERPFWGIGAGAFEARLGQDFSERQQVGVWHTAHNTVVQTFAELGVAGGLILLCLLGSAVGLSLSSWKRRDPGRRPELLAALLGYCAAIMFLSQAYSYILWGVLALFVLVDGAERENRSLGTRARSLRAQARIVARARKRIDVWARRTSASRGAAAG